MFLSSIVKNKQKCIFISPHFDDAIYSAYGLISYLKMNKVEVAIITVFTKADSPSTLSGKQFLKSCGYKSVEELYKDRVEENSVVCNKLQVDCFNLGFTDALWRKKDKMNAVEKRLSKIIPEVGHIYPTYRFHIKYGSKSSKDNELEKKITNTLRKQITNKKDAVLFTPLSLGKHTDHIITRNIVKKLNRTVIYWEDYPYNLKYKDQVSFITTNNLKKFTFADLVLKLKD